MITKLFQPRIWSSPAAQPQRKLRRRKHHGAHYVAWQADTAYLVGRLCISGGNNYVCIQAHTSAAGDNPAAMPLFWSIV
jgi:hypothetical protein